MNMNGTGQIQVIQAMQMESQNPKVILANLFLSVPLDLSWAIISH